MTYNLFRLFGERVKTLRLEKNFSQETLAEMADISDRCLRLIENEEDNPSLKTVYQIAKAFDMTLSQLMEFDISEEEEGDVGEW